MSFLERAKALVSGRKKAVETPDPTVASARIYRQKSLQEIVAEAVASQHFRMLAEKEGMETIDDFEDFEMPEDGDPLDNVDSPHELVFNEDLGREVSKIEDQRYRANKRQFDEWFESETKKKRVKKADAPQSVAERKET